MGKVLHCATLPLALTLLTGFAVLLAFPSVSSVLTGILLFPGVLTSTLLRSVSCRDQLMVVEGMEAPCVQQSSSFSLLLLSSSDFLPSGICSGSRQLPPLPPAQEQDMLVVELSMDLSQNKLVGGHRRLQKLLLLGVCVVFREKMELKEPLSMSALDTHLEAAST